ncbi:MAG: MFS transporter [Bryobacter sp.]|jgi:ACS family hexuronate transporter-like MFS transporter|nr:MFS transporter [Bryobacter sp.]
MSSPTERQIGNVFSQSTQKMTQMRWAILGLLFAATTINYLDRIVFSVLIPVIREDLHLDNQGYGLVTSAFQFAYMIGFLVMGHMIDRFGTRIGYAISIAWWSFAACLHALARTPWDMGAWRALLGFGEAGNFPAAIKSVSEWFPKKDRAFATGIFNAGTNVASMIGPVLFVWMNAHVGWRSCFLITGGLGFVWLVVWWFMERAPDKHPGVNAAELAYIRSDGHETEEKRVSWAEALEHRQTWGFAFAKFFTDPVWWFYLYWLPPYLFDVRKFDLKQIGWALPVVYLMADFGSIFGGWISGYLIRKGWSIAAARKMGMGLCAACMPLAALSVKAESPLLAISLVSLATAAHQGWSANLYTTTSDVFPKRAVATVTGIGGFLGAFGGVIFSGAVPGYVVSHFGYTPIFLTMGCFHLIAFAIVLLTMGKLTPITFSSKPEERA